MKRAVLTLLLAITLGKMVGQTIPPEPAQLILYREKEFMSWRGKAYAFKINGQPMGKLSPNRFVQIALAAGRTEIEFVNDYFTNSRPLRLLLQPGQTYYVKAVVEVDFLRMMMIMAPVDGEQARQELLHMKPEPIQPARRPD